MSTKTYTLVKAILTGCEAIAIGLVSYFLTPTMATPINASIVIGVKAVEEICGKFVTPENK